MKKCFAFILMTIVVTASMSAQAGMRLYGGISGMTNEDPVLHPSGINVGYHIGADLRLNEGGMFFLLGGRYSNIPYTSNEAIYVTDSPVMQVVNTRLGLGYKLFRISDAIVIRGKTLASIDYLYNTPLLIENTQAGFEKYRNINSTASAILGLGLSIGSITFDIEYGIGAFNLISKEKATKPTYISASAGVFF